jgi:eukaryotic-like serine/threonine-protein kinase
MTPRFDDELDAQGDESTADVHETLLPSLTLSVLGGAPSGHSEPGLSIRPTPLPPLVTSPLEPSPSDDKASIGAGRAGEDKTAGTGSVIMTRKASKVPGAKTGDMIGSRYIVEGQLGRGGMGRVMRVRHHALGKAFALKLIKAPIATDPKIREMFYREARLASSLNHENICSIVDFGEDPLFGLFMVMELLDGQTVHYRTRQNGAMSAKAATDVMWQVCSAMRFIHARSIIHGDIKSENILLVRGAQQQRIVKLLDFGLARPDAKRVMGVDGTPEYLSPERIAGGPATQASDIYALGIVFFELLTGKLPFTGDLQQVFAQQVDKPMPLASASGADSLDERADQIIARATAKDPTARHADVGGFMYELRTFMSMLGMEVNRRRSNMAISNEGGTRERRELDHRLKAEAEVFGNVPLPMACCDPSGSVRVANSAFLEFISAAGDAGGIELRDTGIVEVCPTLLTDIRAVGKTRQTIKRVIYLSEGGGRVVEAAIVMTPAPRSAEVTAGEVHILLHPLRSVDMT